MQIKFVRCLLGLALFFHADVSLAQTLGAKNRLKGFAKQVEAFRSRLAIPALSVVVLENQKVIWIRGFGFCSKRGSLSRPVAAAERQLR